MRRGRLRVFLGAAPGVGKTFAMLEAGHDLRAEGRDVVVALVETHDRPATAALLAGLELVPRTRRVHRGLALAELDLPAVLARRPEVALVDELAHTDAPGGPHERRWQDVQVLLDAGIDVLTTLNVQHIASLNDVVQTITGVPQRETVPDEVLRAADQIELVDLPPGALRDRLAEGHVYPAERVDAALAHYFRLGNLTALRELALLWLADEVDSALRAYRATHAIAETWEARERVVVALTGGPEGETLLRRGARIAARSAGGELLAVHVSAQTGLRGADPEALVAQQALTEQLGGTYHQVVGEDVPRALVDFARSVDATQLVIGASRRGVLAAAVTGSGIGSTVIREAGSIDVHLVNHAAAAGRFALPRVGGALTRRRRLVGLLLALVVGPLLSWWLSVSRTSDSLVGDVLAYQLLVIVVALVGGLWPALLTAVASALTLDYLFIEPLRTIKVAESRHVLALALSVVNGLLVSAMVDRAARRSRAARRAAAESELLVTVAGGVLRGQDALGALLARTREAFALTAVRLRVDGAVVAQDGADPGETGPTAAADQVTVLPVTPSATLELCGPAPDASTARLLAVVAAQAAVALEHQHLAATAREVAPLRETDQVRTALLSAVSHDLRRPLTAATTAVSSLRATGLDLTAADRAELLVTAEESLGTLTTLVTDLLDVSRVQAGVLGVSLRATDVDEAVLPALDELGAGPDQVELDLDPTLPAVAADPALLRRVLVNTLANALRYTPAGRRARISTSAFGDRVEIRVADHGPGVAPERRAELFVPFQRLGDTDNQSGLGLGLALSRGFTEGMGGALTTEDTPGGGLTLVIALPVAGPAAGAGAGATAGAGAGGGTAEVGS
ncbi:MAG TPA: ATP-binding protein [Cellulomonas sp.]